MIEICNLCENNYSSVPHNPRFKENKSEKFLNNLTYYFLVSCSTCTTLLVVSSLISQTHNIFSHNLDSFR
jgi:hypothetical protein